MPAGFLLNSGAVLQKLPSSARLGSLFLLPSGVLELTGELAVLMQGMLRLGRLKIKHNVSRWTGVC